MFVEPSLALPVCFFYDHYLVEQYKRLRMDIKKICIFKRCIKLYPSEKLVASRSKRQALTTFYKLKYQEYPHQRNAYFPLASYWVESVCTYNCISQDISALPKHWEYIFCLTLHCQLGRMKGQHPGLKKKYTAQTYKDKHISTINNHSSSKINQVLMIDIIPLYALTFKKTEGAKSSNVRETVLQFSRFSQIKVANCLKVLVCKVFTLLKLCSRAI